MARRKKTTDEIPVDTSTTNDDNFGLPDIDYKPLDRDAPVVQEVIVEQQITQPEPTYTYQEPEPVATEPTEQYVAPEPVEQPTYTYTEPEEERSSVAPKIIGIVVVLLLAAGAIWYFASYRPKQQAAQKALIEQKRKDAEKVEQDRLAEEQRQAEGRRRAEELAAANAIPKEGAIETLGGRTQRYYVVAASSIDSDLVMDYAKKLSAKGVSSKIIPPYGKTKFSRLTVADGETYADAQKTADGMKGNYGDALWVIKY